MRTATRLCTLFFCGLMLAGCSDSNSGGTSAGAPLQSSFNFGLVRADITTIARVTLPKAFVGAANLTLVSASGAFSEAPSSTEFELSASYQGS